jgi:metal-dependent amidase/aminoacylase/carboxypeptidase family protein
MNPLMSEAAALAGQLTAWRRDFHQHPELGFQEVRSAGLIAAELRALGLEVRTGVGQTGVVGLLEGAAAGPAVGPLDGPTVLIRCDMDALPITEQNDVPTPPPCRAACTPAATTATWRLAWG